MKFTMQADFTKFPRATSMLRAAEADGTAPADRAVLAHDERHLRRRALPLENGERILVDLTEPATLGQGDRLVLEDGRQVEIVAAEAVLGRTYVVSQEALDDTGTHVPAHDALERTAGRGRGSGPA